MTEIVALHGYAAASTDSLSSRAELPRAAFFQCWATVEACFLEAFDERCSEVSLRMLIAAREATGETAGNPASETTGETAGNPAHEVTGAAADDTACEADPWEGQVAAATGAALNWCEHNPLAARAILFESVAVSTRVAWRLSRALDHLADLIHTTGIRAANLNAADQPPNRAIVRAVATDHSGAAERRAPSPALARALVRKAHAILHDALQVPPAIQTRRGAKTRGVAHPRLIDIAPALTSMIVLQYAGEHAAARQLAGAGHA